MLIYIASPYSLGDTEDNVRRACLAGDEILKKGHTPFIPHLFHHWHKISPKDYHTWCDIGIEFLWRCDALLRLPGESNGADFEVKEAEEAGIFIYRSIDDVPDSLSDKNILSIAKDIADAMGKNSNPFIDRTQSQYPDRWLKGSRYG